MKNLTLAEIKNARMKLPDNWRWDKRYELSYLSSRTGITIILKHWALSPPDSKGLVCSLGLISHDNFSASRNEFLKNDEGAKWVENSLQYFDFLLTEIDRLTAFQSATMNIADADIEQFIYSEYPKGENESPSNQFDFGKMACRGAMRKMAEWMQSKLK